MHVCDATGREAEEAEDDVLHAGRQERVAVRDELARLLVEEVEHDRQVVDAE